MDPGKTIFLHGTEFNRADLQSQIDVCRRRDWRRQRWTPRDALVHGATGMTVLYAGQPYDRAEFKLLPGGLKQSQCEICNWELCESNDPAHFMGFTDGRRWVCGECHDHFLRRGVGLK